MITVYNLWKNNNYDVFKYSYRGKEIPLNIRINYIKYRDIINLYLFGIIIRISFSKDSSLELKETEKSSKLYLEYENNKYAEVKDKFIKSYDSSRLSDRILLKNIKRFENSK